MELEGCRRFLSQRVSYPVVFATVSGAHLYGFESPDSDIDLRGSFVLPVEEVLGLREPSDTQTVSTIEEGLEMDFVAHDVLKFCRLMTRRNGYVLEQLYSPLVVAGGPWHDELRHLGAGCITRHLHHHYRGFLNNQLHLLTREEPTVKALLYAYRVALTGIHVLQSGRIEAHLPTLLEALPTRHVSPLIERKRAGGEVLRLQPGELELHQSALRKLEEDLHTAFERSALPDDVSCRDGLSELVVRLRLGRSG